MASNSRYLKGKRPGEDSEEEEKGMREIKARFGSASLAKTRLWNRKKRGANKISRGRSNCAQCWDRGADFGTDIGRNF